MRGQTFWNVAVPPSSGWEDGLRIAEYENLEHQERRKKIFKGEGPELRQKEIRDRICEFTSSKQQAFCQHAKDLARTAQ